MSNVCARKLRVASEYKSAPMALMKRLLTSTATVNHGFARKDVKLPTSGWYKARSTQSLMISAYNACKIPLEKVYGGASLVVNSERFALLTFATTLHETVAVPS